MAPAAMYLGEFVGTAALLFFGNGICMTTSLNKSYGKGSGWIVICMGWGLAVTMSVYMVGWVSGGHLNPAVTLGLATAGMFPWKLVPGYIISQVAGAFLGACLAYLTYKDLMDEEPEAGTKLGVFSTGPAIENKPMNMLTEFLGTFLLLVGILAIGYGDGVTGGMAPFMIGMLIAVIGMATGGATGFAINPARDLGPRIAHAILPIKGKGGSNWGYALVPIIGPILGGIVGAVFYAGFIQMVN